MENLKNNKQRVYELTKDYKLLIKEVISDLWIKEEDAIKDAYVRTLLVKDDMTSFNLSEDRVMAKISNILQNCIIRMNYSIIELSKQYFMEDKESMLSEFEFEKNIYGRNYMISSPKLHKSDIIKNITLADIIIDIDEIIELINDNNITYDNFKDNVQLKYIVDTNTYSANNENPFLINFNNTIFEIFNILSLFKFE